MKHSASPPPPKYPPLTSAQQRQVLAYRQIAGDYARRLAAPYSRLIDADEATSIADLTLCRAAQRHDPERAALLWPLAKMMIPQQISLALRAAMARARGRCGMATMARQEAPQATPAEREALRTIIAWAEEDPTRAETIDRAVSGADMTLTDLDLLESLRDELGMLTPEAVDVAAAAARMGRSPKALRSALIRGTVPGYRCGATWRVYLGAALRIAA